MSKQQDEQARQRRALSAEKSKDFDAQFFIERRKTEASNLEKTNTLKAQRLARDRLAEPAPPRKPAKAAGNAKPK